VTDVSVDLPKPSANRGPLYWTRDANLWAGRRRLRSDDSNNWRYDFEREYRNRAPALASFAGTPGAPSNPAARVIPMQSLLDRPTDGNLRFLILGDTGEGDHSQYGLLPAIRAVQPDFMIINGDVAYPAGEMVDFEEGFFEPYRDLRIPILAVPGNHEYYSEDHGSTFYEIFCTRLHEDRWSRAGLRSVPQPGTYWELRDTASNGGAARRSPLVVIGVDSGQEGNLDGRLSFIKKIGSFFNKAVGQAAGDRRQYDWLDERLTAADAEGARVIVLFHIPALVDGQHKTDIGLVRLHQIIAVHPCVRLVVTAHIHNYQQYTPETFGDYLAKEMGRSSSQPPHYIVCGNGGAGLSRSDFKAKYPTVHRCPEAKQWADYIRQGRLYLSRYAKVHSGLIGKVARLFDRALGADPDAPWYLSMILVEVGGPTPDPRGPIGTGPGPANGEIRVRPLCLDDLEGLVNGKVAGVPEPGFVPGGAVLRAQDPQHRLTPQALESCLPPLWRISF